jgi:uncharacterized protein (DUF488 family)
MSVVYTVGYEGTDIDRFIATLKAVGIKTLADVRAIALSRKKGFSKTALKQRLEAEGIQYIHFVALGDPKPGREAARSGRMSEFQRIYRKHLATSEANEALQELENVVWSTPSCLLCFERDPSVCHRSIVTEKLSMSGVNVFDLFGDNPSAYVSHAAKLPSYHPRQGAAAA